MKLVYGVFALMGAAIPLSQFVPWLLQHGLDFPLFFQQAFGSNLAAFAWLDVVISAVVLFIFIIMEGRRLDMHRLWLPVLGTCTVGVSFGLPLFLMMREFKLNEHT